LRDAERPNGADINLQQLVGIVHVALTADAHGLDPAAEVPRAIDQNVKPLREIIDELLHRLCLAHIDASDDGDLAWVGFGHGVQRLRGTAARLDRVTALLDNLFDELEAQDMLRIRNQDTLVLQVGAVVDCGDVEIAGVVGGLRVGKACDLVRYRVRNTFPDERSRDLLLDVGVVVDRGRHPDCGAS